MKKQGFTDVSMSDNILIDFSVNGKVLI